MKTLVIIGNGFDLAHNLLTRFNDFVDTLPECKREEYNRFENKDNDWNEIESKYKTLLQEELNKRDFLSILDETDQVASMYGVNRYGEIDCFGYINETYKKNIKQIFEHNNLLVSFEKEFLMYLRDKCSEQLLAKIKPFKEVDKILQSATDIVTFNYTNTIEIVYKIKYVKHIHGNVDDSIIIGAGAIDDLKETMIDGEYATRDMFEPTKHGLADFMRFYEDDTNGNWVERKDIKRVFDQVKQSAEECESELFELLDERNKDKLKERLNIIEHLQNTQYDKVYIIGHSLNGEDAPVLKAIKAKEIVCYYYENSERNEHKIMRDRIEQLQLNNCQLVSDKEIFA